MKVCTRVGRGRAVGKQSIPEGMTDGTWQSGGCEQPPRFAAEDEVTSPSARPPSNGRSGPE